MFPLVCLLLLLLFLIHKLSKTCEDKQHVLAGVVFIFSTRKMILLKVLDAIVFICFYWFLHILPFMNSFVCFWSMQFMQNPFCWLMGWKDYYAVGLNCFHPIISYIPTKFPYSLIQFWIGWKGSSIFRYFKLYKKNLRS